MTRLTPSTASLVFWLRYFNIYWQPEYSLPSSILTTWIFLTFQYTDYLNIPHLPAYWLPEHSSPSSILSTQTFLTFHLCAYWLSEHSSPSSILSTWSFLTFQYTDYLNIPHLAAYWLPEYSSPCSTVHTDYLTIPHLPVYWLPEHSTPCSMVYTICLNIFYHLVCCILTTRISLTLYRLFWMMIGQTNWICTFEEHISRKYFVNYVIRKTRENQNYTCIRLKNELFYLTKLCHCQLKLEKNLLSLFLCN